MERLIVVTTYPPKDSIHGNRFSAVASYAKNTVQSIKQNSSESDYIILADVLEKKEEYKEESITVRRIWERNSISIFSNLLAAIKEYPEHKKILFEFEFGMFGGKKYLIVMLPIFILLLRLMQKEVYLVSHGVILTADEVSIQLGLESSIFKRKIFNVGLKVMYWLVMSFSNKVIVFEEYLKDRLVQSLGLNKNKIVVIPHGVESNRNVVEKSTAREALGLKKDDFVITCFGFLIWYKGSDWLIKAFSDLYKNNKIPQNTKLIMAGGFSATHEGDPIYKEYMANVREQLNIAGESIIFTDFLSEEMIDLYFSASDLIVMPHRVLISASGPFSFAISHKKPFILSKSLSGYMDNEDFKNAMSTEKVTEDMVFFDQTDTKDLGNLINNYSKNSLLLGQLSKISEDLIKQRNWSTVGKKYHGTIF